MVGGLVSKDRDAWLHFAPASESWRWYWSRGHGWFALWAGAGTDLVLGTLVWLLLRRRPRRLGPASLLAFAFAVASLGAAVTEILQGALLARGELAHLAAWAPIWARICASAFAVGIGGRLLLDVVRIAARWTDERLGPDPSRSRTIALSLCVSLPLALVLPWAPARHADPTWVRLLGPGLLVATIPLLAPRRAVKAAAAGPSPAGWLGGVAWIATAAAAIAVLPPGLPRTLDADWAGEKPRIFRARFPAVLLVDGLIEDPVRLDGGNPPHLVAFTPWLDGEPVLVRGPTPEAATYEALGADLRVRGRFDLPEVESLFDLAPLASTADPRLVAMGPSSDDARGPIVGVTLAGSGRPSWSWHSDGEHHADVAPLFGDGRAVGLVFSLGGGWGESELVGMDLAGTERWRVAAHGGHPSTHPRLPGLLLTTGGGDVTLYEGASERHPPTETFSTEDTDGLTRIGTPGRTFLRAAVLFPDEQGAPTFVAVGHVARTTEPVLLRLHGSGTAAWRATLPASGPLTIPLLEPREGPRLVVVATEQREIFVVDERGRLRGQTRIPGAGDGLRARFRFRAGPFGADGWAMAASTRDGTWLWRLHPERIPMR